MVFIRGDHSGSVKHSPGVKKQSYDRLLQSLWYSVSTPAEEMSQSNWECLVSLIGEHNYSSTCQFLSKIPTLNPSSTFQMSHSVIDLGFWRPHEGCVWGRAWKVKRKTFPMPFNAFPLLLHVAHIHKQSNAVMIKRSIQLGKNVVPQTC